MTEFHIKIANKVAAVTAQYDSTRDFCAGYLTEDSPDFSITITPADIDFEREKSRRENPLQVFPDPYLETLSLQRKLAEALFQFNVLLFHGSALSMDGAGYLFTAPSGTGKSTHTRIWREVFRNRVQMINDDKPFLILRDDSVAVCGSPWNGKHRLGENIQVPLKAICILQRGERNEIRAISPGDALYHLLQQSNRPMDRRLMPKYMEQVDRLAGSVSFYLLSCNMDPDAARTAYRGMTQKN